MPPDTDLLAFINLYKRFGIECKIIDDNDRLEIIMSDGHPVNYQDETIDKRIHGKKTKIIFDYNGKYIEQYS